MARGAFESGGVWWCGGAAAPSSGAVQAAPGLIRNTSFNASSCWKDEAGRNATCSGSLFGSWCNQYTGIERWSVHDLNVNTNIYCVEILHGCFTFLDDEIDAESDFLHASCLVSFIKETFGSKFNVGVAGYPSGHPEAKSLAEDLLHLKEKVQLFQLNCICCYFSSAI